MPAKASRKRPAAAEEGPVAKKLATAHDGSIPTILGEAIFGAANFPPNVLEMLNTLVSPCWGVPKEMRHRFHERVLEMVREVLGSVEAGIQSGVDAAAKQLAEGAAERATREAAAEAAAAVVTKTAEATEAASNERSESASKLAAAEAALSTAESEQKAFDAAASKRTRLASAITDVFEPLKQGTTSDVAPLLRIGRECSLEPALLTALPNAFAKAPGERGSFDKMVLREAEAEFAKCAVELDETIANGEQAKEERAAKAAAAAAEVTAAGHAERACNAAFETAMAEQKEAESGQRAAAEGLRQLGPDVKRAAAELDRAKAELQKFKEGPSAAFQRLLDYTLVPPAVEVPPEEAVPEAAESVPAAAPEEETPESDLAIDDTRPGAAHPDQ